GHFEAVATVVLKLLGIVNPDRAYFGEKDIQQLTIIRRLVDDFNVPVDIVEVPTVRDPDGLAISSRNRFLGPSERHAALALYRALMVADRQIRGGMQATHDIISAANAEMPNDPTIRLEYLEIVDPVDMQPVDHVTGSVRVAGALWVGSTRLIDNVL